MEIYTNHNFLILVKRFKSRQEFSDFTKISINTIKGILDKNNKPNLETLIKLNQCFNISLDSLVFEKLA